jgi:hypothetical protein
LPKPRCNASENRIAGGFDVEIISYLDHATMNEPMALDLEGLKSLMMLGANNLSVTARLD